MKNKTIFAALLPFCFTIGLAISADPSGNWAGNADSPNGPVEIAYTFKVDGQKLTGSVTGPQGTVDLQNGTYKDSVLAFDIITMRGALHQAGKYYGDSIALDFTVRDKPIHMKLLKK